MTQKYNCFATYAKEDKKLLRYHDLEWGKPSHDEQYLIEMFILELFQAGLSWSIIYHKKAAFKKAFSNFDIHKIAKYTTNRQEKLMQNPGIIRNRLKIQATVENAKHILDIQQEFGSFENYIWHFSNHETIFEDMSITTNWLSDTIAKDLKKRQFKFAGSTTIYSYLQAVGIIYSHDPKCWRYEYDCACGIIHPKTLQCL